MTVDRELSPEERHIRMEWVCFYNLQLERPSAIEDSHLLESQHPNGFPFHRIVHFVKKKGGAVVTLSVEDVIKRQSKLTYS